MNRPNGPRTIKELHHLLQTLEQKMEAARQDLEQAQTNLAWQVAKDIFDTISRQYTEIASDLEQVQLENALHRYSSEGLKADPNFIMPVHNIPVQRPPFVGRITEREELSVLIASEISVVLVDGLGGIGKTALVKTVCRSLLKEGVFDTVVWLTAKDRPLTITDIIDTAAQVIGIYPRIQDLALSSRRSITIDALGKRHSILVLDNLTSSATADVFDLLDSLPDTINVIITSRERLELGAAIYSVSPLSETDGLTFIHKFGEYVRARALFQKNDRQKFDIYETSGGSPLAMVWAAGRIAQHGQTLERVLKDLKRAKGEVFKQLFGDISDALSENARKTLFALAVLPGPATQPLLRQSTDLTQEEVEQALDQLVSAWLTDPSDDITRTHRRYELHPLTRAFASTRDLRISLPSPEVLKRASEYYKHIVRQRTSLDPVFVREELSQALSIADRLEEVELFAEFQSLVAEIANPLEKHGMLEQRLAYSLRAVEACQRIGDREAEAWHAAFSVAHCLIYNGEIDKAENYALDAMQIAEETGSKRIKAIALGNLGTIQRNRKQWREAEDSLERALELWTELEDTYWMIVSKLAISGIVSRNGKFEKARIFLERAMEEANSIQDEELVSIALGLLGRVSLARKDGKTARLYYIKALDLCREIGRINGEPYSFLGLARASELEGINLEALKWYKKAEQGFKELHMLWRSEMCREAIINLEKDLDCE
jgi:tetratricopeptide (TPR) repeat protein